MHAAALAPALTALALAGACSRTPPPDQPVEQVEDPSAARAAEGAAESTSPRAGEIARADLNRVLDAGPGAFLARTEVKARLVKGQFRGWQVVR
ncbi:MAG TPA: hypothetical protein VNO33_03070, partial [Kofleriaceae bacterium]|nr:hypothetical protein [Kofleriaceae bacterium]